MSIRSKIITATVAVTLGTILASGVAVAYTGIPAGFTFTKNLNVGSINQDVVYLKVVLANEGCLTGVSNTTLFGPKTAAAVKCFKAKYGVGTATSSLVSTLTNAKLNTLIAGTACTTNADCLAGKVCTAGVCVTPPDGEEIGEGTLTIKLKASPVNLTEVREEETKAVMAFELKARDAAVTVQRIDFVFEDDADGAISIWKFVDYIALYDGANPVEGVEAERSAFTKLETEYGDDYEDSYMLRLSGLNISIPKDSIKTLTLKVTAVGAVAADEEINAIIPEDGVRGVDTAGLTVYIGDIERDFVVTTEAEGDVEVSLNADTPEASPIFADEDDVTEDIPVLAFDIKAQTTDVEINEITVELDDVSQVVNSVKLYSGTTLLDSFSVETADDDAVFEDLEIDIAKNATKTFTVKVDVIAVGEDSDDVPPGTEISVADLGDIVFTDANDNETTLDDGDDAIPGEAMYIYTVAPVLTLTSTSIALLPDPNSDVADGSIVFTLKAKGGDITVAQEDAITVAEQVAGNADVDAGFSYTSTANEVGDDYVIYSGQTKTFTVIFSMTADTANQQDGGMLDDFVWTCDVGAQTWENTWTSDDLLEDFETARVLLIP